MSKIFKFVFIILGCLLFAWVLQKVDLASVLDLMRKFGSGFIWIIFIYGIVIWWDTLSWKYAFKPAEAKTFPITSLFKIRTIGESFNALTPLGTLGGEPVKAQLLKDHHGLGFKQGLASQVVGRTTLLISLIFFFIPGVYLLLHSSSISSQFIKISLTALTIFSTLIFLFLIFQITGGLGKFSNFLSKLFKINSEDGFLSQFITLDQMMSSYYQKHSKEFWASISYGFLGWVTGILELYVTTRFLGMELSIQKLWLIEALTQLIRVCSFFIPLSFGAQEGGLIWIFKSMGMSVDLGLTVSLVRRVRELVWIGIGLLMGWEMALRPSRARASSLKEP